MPSTIFCHLASLSLSEPISFISISPRLSIWSGGCSEALPISSFSLNAPPQPSANPSPRLISLFDVVYLILIYIFIFKIYVALLLLHLLPLHSSDPSFSAAIHAGGAIMNNNDNLKKKKRWTVGGGHRSLKMKPLWDESAPKALMVFPALEYRMSEDVNYLQHHQKGRRLQCSDPTRAEN